jgi:hypothetical protein
VYPHERISPATAKTPRSGSLRITIAKPPRRAARPVMIAIVRKSVLLDIAPDAIGCGE